MERGGIAAGPPQKAGCGLTPTNRKTKESTMNTLTVRTIGGPTAVLDYAGSRIVLDPTFDGPRTYQNGPVTATKLSGPSAPPEDLDQVDVVLVSHEHHIDNLDISGREYARQAQRVFTTKAGAKNLGPRSVGLRPFEHAEVGDIRVTAVPALHGTPEIGVVNGPVIGFVLEANGWPTVYVSGDNASLDVVAVVAEQFPAIEIAILNLGAARIAVRGEGLLTLSAELAARAAALLGVRAVVPVHQDGWGHYTQDADDVVRAFEEAGLTDVLVDLRPGNSATI
ncbi:MBL fold metallo-hydrolase [Micromonospora sp. RHAY321]|uniref:MBL fold metallo-hydrolase n=1 Tax=Micromonospora sp. RHAY321 TaxID=2944807 RepID=UPI00207CA301|nr:MBL fold metallo-hydrolase [Micromonospora sp. RHAY321]MCO1597453.1 MBL fold metallo-hydrolase [Micromonospora sp. RHAY321]